MQHRSAIRVLLSVSIVSVALAGLAVGQTTSGSWSLYPQQSTLYTTSVQQPINADGTSTFKWTGKSVIPVKFSLSTSPGPVVFHSIGSDEDPANDYSYLSFMPSSVLSFGNLTTLSTDYTFLKGNCGGGSLRWQVRLNVGNDEDQGNDRNIFVYYGAVPNFTECTSGAADQSGVNMLLLGDARFDTSQLGGTFYDNYAGAFSKYGDLQVVAVSLVLDGGWMQDQAVTVEHLKVNDNTFVPLSVSFPTCDLPPATIQVTKMTGADVGTVIDPLSAQPKGNDAGFRILDCKYVYNLTSSSLPGPGQYKVEAVNNGIPAAGAAIINLRQ